ncbi:MAG: hypothetical protein EOP38_10380 [Rubrivivax sp.]|nr:MAG: hypothetical protein EOP38_10380 [Rubrivivax sp.]
MDFQVIGSDGSNRCLACPVDPGAQGAQKCWIADSQKTQVAMLLMAYAQDKKIFGRVPAFASDCTVYEISVQD